jgi:hypothetical protein
MSDLVAVVDGERAKKGIDLQFHWRFRRLTNDRVVVMCLLCASPGDRGGELYLHGETAGVDQRHVESVMAAVSAPEVDTLGDYVAAISQCVQGRVDLTCVVAFGHQHGETGAVLLTADEIGDARSG